jgi:P-loop Domain of unknown function (DUF2791)
VIEAATDPRRSIESLRAGVPNRDAVKDLGTDQSEIQARFLNSLAEVPAQWQQERQLAGFLIQGGFGTGKSHLLEWLQHLALSQGFAVSKVVVSKEAPLNDPHKVFRAAVENLRLPDRRGISGLHEVASALDFRSEAYRGLVERVRRPDSYDPLFAATLYLFENLRAGDQEFVDRLVSFWAGDPLGIADLRRALRLLGIQQFEIRSRKRGDLAFPRFRFVADLMAAAGRYQGWVILLDEVELVANFSLGARARSYAMLAHLLGVLPEAPIPGVLVIGCATDDFTGKVFHERRDHETVPQRLGAYPALIPEAEAGMSFMWPESPDRWMKIRRLEQGGVEAIYNKIRALYAGAHAWSPPAEDIEWLGYDRSLRQYVREWITRWDLQRIYPEYQPQIETVDLRPDLEERPDLEQPSEEDDPENAVN